MTYKVHVYIIYVHNTPLGNECVACTSVGDNTTFPLQFCKTLQNELTVLRKVNGSHNYGSKTVYYIKHNVCVTPLTLLLNECSALRVSRVLECSNTNTCKEACGLLKLCGSERAFKLVTHDATSCLSYAMSKQQFYSFKNPMLVFPNALK